MMRTTVTLEEDVARRLGAFMRETGLGLKAALNGILRLGFEARAQRQPPRPYRVPVFDSGGVRAGIDLDRIHETLEVAEGPGFR